MKVVERTVLADAEVVELLREEPTLLAIADAIAATQQAPRRRPRVPARVLVAAAAVALVLVAGQVQPWQGGGDAIVERALAAVGHGPVLHARIVARSRTSEVVDLRTGEAVPVTIAIDYWFDEERGLLRSVVRRDGVVVEEMLERPAGGESTFGAIDRAPGTRPALSPALAGFVSGYREALASGSARRSGAGEVDGRAVVWLEFTVDGGGTRLAVDEATGRPVLLEHGAPTGEPVRWRIAEIGTRGRERGQFVPPEPYAALPVRGDVRSSTVVSPAAAAQRLAWPALWLGPSFQGLELTVVRLDELSEGYPPEAGRAPTRGEGLRLLYGDHAGAFAEVKQAPRPQTAYGFVAQRTFDGGTLPEQGKAVLHEQPGEGASQWLAQLRRDRVHVTIACSGRDLCLEAARALGELTTAGDTG